MTESNAFDNTFGEILKTSDETWFVIIFLTVKVLIVYFLKANKGGCDINQMIIQG
jgi:hypothetical protein